MSQNGVICMSNRKPSAANCKNCNHISNLYKQSGEPIYYTKKGEDYLVVMDMKSCAQRESIFKLNEKLLQSELDIQKGRLYSVEETVAALRKVITESRSRV